MKYAWMHSQRKLFPLPAMCEALSVSVSGYRAWKRGGSPTRKWLTDLQLLAVIQAIHKALKGAYGSPRMVRELRGRGIPASKPRVERLMRDNDIRGRHKRRYKATTDSKHPLPIAENLLDRDSLRQRPIRRGLRTLRTSGPTKAGSIWRWCSICLTARSSAGRSSRG